MAKGISIHIGLNHVDPKHYQGWDGALNACIADANDMRALAKKKGFAGNTLFVDGQATAAAVSSALLDAGKKLVKGDLLFLTYSGHGGQVRDTNSDEKDNDRMARPLRIEYDGAQYHVTSRGNERKAIFRDDTDRELFLATLSQVVDRFHWICHAYCLMDNHYHLVIETPDGNLSKGMRQLNGVYTQAFDRRHLRVGHLFQGRFKGILVQEETTFSKCAAT